MLPGLDDILLSVWEEVLEVSREVVKLIAVEV